MLFHLGHKGCPAFNEAEAESEPSQLLDEEITTCIPVFPAANVTRTEVVYEFDEQITGGTTISLFGKNLDCTSGALTVALHQVVIGGAPSNGNIYRQCALNTQEMELMKVDSTTKCQMTCLCPNSPCDSLYIRFDHYMWMQNVDFYSWQLCHVTSGH